ncbi:DUF4238 domain-containing protein [Halobacterium salinarum]
MPERKNQHYVPQHFLKGWATDNVVNVLPLSEGEISVPHKAFSASCF